MTDDLPADNAEQKHPEQQFPYSLATLQIHADDPLNSYTDVAPAIHVSTTFRYPRNPDDLVPSDDNDVPDRDPLMRPSSSDSYPKSDAHIYSRLSSPNTTRLEAILTSLLHGPTLVYSSGLSGFHALLIHTHPKTVAIGLGYHGCHGVLDIYKKLTNCTILDLHALDKESDPKKAWPGLGKGDVVHIESPLNPTGMAHDIARYAKAAHEVGAKVIVDATFGPPPLQDPFMQGADYVMHSGTKYFGGHSDMLCGVVTVGVKDKKEEEWKAAYWELYRERLHLGSVMGSLEGWMGVRSLRTLELRVRRQSENATELVRWLNALLNGGEANGHANGDVSKDDVQVVKAALHGVLHASLQTEGLGPDGWLTKQMHGGFGPVFGITMTSQDFARRLPSKLHLFHHATSLGGVESLIEWRYMSDPQVDKRLLRVSVGIENIEDLKRDFLGAFRALAREAESGGNAS